MVDALVVVFADDVRFDVMMVAFSDTVGSRLGLEDLAEEFVSSIRRRPAIGSDGGRTWWTCSWECTSS